MRTKIPGPIAKDGQPIDDPESELTAFVQQSEFLEFTPEDFVSSYVPLVYAASEPPAERAPGLLWFDLTEGRLKLWFTQGVTASAYTTSTDAKILESSPNHFLSVSDRKQIYAQVVSQYEHNHVWPYSVLRVGAGGLLPSTDVSTADLRTWHADFNRDMSFPDTTITGVWGEDISFHGFVVHPWLGRILGSKLVASTTGYTYPGSSIGSGVFHELGYARVACISSATGPGFGAVRDILDGGVVPSGATVLSFLSRRVLDSYADPYNSGYSLGYGVPCYFCFSGTPEGDPPRGLVFWLSTTLKNQFEQQG